MSDENTADPSPALDAAQDAAIADNDFAAYQATENARDQGKDAPEAPPAKSDKPAADSEPAKPIQEKPKNAETRKAELNAEIAELLKTRAELQGKIPGEKKEAETPAADKPKEPSDKPKPSEKPKAPIEPKMEDFETVQAWQAADRKYVRELVQFETRETLATAEAEKAAGAANRVLEDRWTERKAAATAKHPDFAEVAFRNMPVNAATDGFILDSEIGPEILYHLQLDSQADGKRIFALSPYAAVRALVAIEAQLLGKAAPAAAPVIKKHTAAPPPATDLGARTSAPADSVAAALKDGNVGEYMRLANAAEVKARRPA